MGLAKSNSLKPTYIQICSFIVNIVGKICENIKYTDFEVIF